MAADTKVLKRRLARLSDEHQELMQRCGAGVLFLDARGVILRSNLTAREMLGLPALPPEDESLLHTDLGGKLAGMFEAVRKRMETEHQEIRFKGAGDRAIHVTVSPVGEDDPAKCRFLVIVHDVTELRRLEQIRRDFVANVSHELRTPLASIRAMAETLQDGALADDTVSDHFLETIIGEAQRLTRISEDLLILSDAESRIPEKAPFDLAALICELVDRYQPAAERSTVVLQIALPDTLPASANRDQIEQVLVNLVDNAIKYTPAGGRVRISAEHESDSLAVHVADTGIGIKAKDLPRIFERFYRVDKARSRQSGGTGLGLSIVKHIVESHGGRVTVKSEYGRGSTFTFSLPASLTKS